MFAFHLGVWRGQHEFVLAAPCCEFLGHRGMGAHVCISECLYVSMIGCVCTSKCAGQGCFI